LRKLGEDVSEMLEYVPASFFVVRHVRPKLSCTKSDHIVQASAPSRPIERGIAGPGLLAHVLVSKYADHLPLYRQSEIYARQGIELERSTMADWVGGTSQLLEPLLEVLRRYVTASGKLHADDIPVPVLAPGPCDPCQRADLSRSIKSKFSRGYSQGFADSGSGVVEEKQQPDAKQHGGSDRIKPNQIRWLEARLRCDISPKSFVIFEWRL
jgi:transposase